MKPTSFAHMVALLAPLALAPSVAFAQVEARCLPGWDTLPTPPSGGGQHVVVACAHDPLQIVVTDVEHGITPGSSDESGLATQVAARLSETGNGTATPFRNETIAGIPARVSDVSGSESAAGGATARVGGQLLLIPVGGRTEVVMAISRNAEHSDVRPALRAFLPTVIGLNGVLPPWRASATCPAGTTAAPTEGASRGMRAVVRCGSEDTMQLEALESHLPLRNADDGRAPADAMYRSLSGQLGRIGGQVNIDSTQTVTVAGTQGYLTAVHASASDPRAPPGTSAEAIRIEAAVLAIPTPTHGHVEIIGVTRTLAPADLARQMLAFANDNLRLDGSGVPSATATTGDGGAAAAAPETEAPHPQHEVDLSQPLWEPPPAERPQATEPAPKKGCGCSVPGAPVRLALGSLVAVAAVVSSVRRRKRTR